MNSVLYYEDILGKTFNSNTYGEFEVVNQPPIRRNNRTYFLAKFIKTGYETLATKSNIQRGAVKDNFLPSVHGVGFLGDVSIKGKEKEYKLWLHVLERCYLRQEDNNKAYKNVTICERWHCFANFIEDIVEIENYELWKSGEKFHLDKDAKSKDKFNKIYSLETCSFLTPLENNRLIDKTNQIKICQHVFLYKKTDETEWKEFSGIQAFTKLHPKLHRVEIRRCLDRKIKQIKGYEFMEKLVEKYE